MKYSEKLLKHAQYYGKMAGFTEEQGVRYLSNEKNNYAPLQETVLFTIDADEQIHKAGTSWKRDREYIQGGMAVQKIPAVRLPAGFGFMAAHPCATVAPVKLEDYTIHDNSPGISGSLVEGRICYDAFVLDNKVKAIYYQAQPASGETVSK